MIIEVGKTFEPITITSGIIQNTSRIYTLELSETAEEGDGVFIYPLHEHVFTEKQLFVRCVDGTARVRVTTPFEFETGGSQTVVSGVGTNYVLPTASTTRKGGIKVGEGLVMHGEYLAVTVTGGGDENVIENIAVDGTVQPINNKTVNISLSSLAKKTDLPQNILRYKGTVAYRSDLPATGQEVGDVYEIKVAGGTDAYGVAIKAGDTAFWDGFGWNVLSGEYPVATRAKDGLMSSYDKEKLDNIDPNGEENMIEAIRLDGIWQSVTNKVAELDLSSYAKKTDTARLLRFKYSVVNYNHLPVTGNEIGDVYNIQQAGGSDIDGVAIKAGDNVVWTDSGWDILAGIYETSYNAFTGATSISAGGAGLVPAPNAGDQNKVLYGNGYWGTVGTEYTLPPATTTTLGGIVVGDGLQINQAGLLNVTLEAKHYTDFVGATSISGGASGLVIKPNAGDEDKFLRGDGTWAEANMTVINMGGSAMIIDTKVPAIQGALWQDVISGAPCLKFRYNDYEYNYYYDTQTRVSGVSPVLETGSPMLYVLDTVPATVDGGLWYELENSAPVLKIHDGRYNYGYLYDTITYKGDEANLYSYLPLSITTSDALGKTWTSAGELLIVDNPVVNNPNAFGGSALQNLGVLRVGTMEYNATKIITNKQGVVEFWLSVPSGENWETTTTQRQFLTINAHTSNTHIAGNFSFGIKQGNIWRSALSYSNFQIISARQLTKDSQIIGNRTHVAITGDGKLYLDGVQIATNLFQFTSSVNNTTQNATYWTGVRIYNTDTNKSSPPMYIDHFRIWTKLVWSGDFTPPVAADYL